MTMGFTPEVRANILRALRWGASPDIAAQVAGVSPELLFGWLARGLNEPSGPYHEFAGEVDRATLANDLAEVPSAGLAKVAMAAWRSIAIWMFRMCRCHEQEIANPAQYGFILSVDHKCDARRIARGEDKNDDLKWRAQRN